MRGALRDMATVIASRAAGQGLLLAATLYVTPFIAPETFGYVGLFTSVVAIASQLSSGRAEAVALAARRSGGGARFIALAYRINLVVFALLAAVALVGQAVVGGALARVMLVAFPVCVLFQSLNQYVLPAQITLSGRAGAAGRQIGVAAAVTAGLQVAAAHLWPFAAALIGARALGQGAGALSVWPFVRAGVGQALTRGAGSRLRRRPVWREFSLSAPSAILTILAFQVPAYVFGWFGLIAEVGLFWLGFNLLFTPYLVISASVRPILLRRISAAPRGAGLVGLLRRACLAGAVVGGGLAIGVAGVTWFGIGMFLGPDWMGARQVTLALAVIVVGLSLQLPLTAAVPAIRAQRPNFAMNVTQLVLRAAVLIGALWLGAAPVVALLAMALASLAISVGYTVLMLRWLGRRAAARM